MCHAWINEFSVGRRWFSQKVLVTCNEICFGRKSFAWNISAFNKKSRTMWTEPESCSWKPAVGLFSFCFLLFVRSSGSSCGIGLHLRNHIQTFFKIRVVFAQNAVSDWIQRWIKDVACVFEGIGSRRKFLCCKISIVLYCFLNRGCQWLDCLRICFYLSRNRCHCFLKIPALVNCRVNLCKCIFQWLNIFNIGYIQGLEFAYTWRKWVNLCFYFCRFRLPLCNHFLTLCNSLFRSGLCF